MTDPGSRVGTWFGPYQLKRLLGRGGMGEVYEAEDARKHRVVALKLISEQYSNSPEFRARMQREADTAGRLTEPHVVPIHDYGEINGQFYVDMRLIDGTSLRDIVVRDGPLPPARAVAIVRQIAAALDAAHANGIMHRDVKPENILVTANDFAYLVDFGIARAATDPGLTQTGTAIGTYRYMAPERFSGDEVSYPADVYALACVLAECLTGAPPYRANSIEQLVAAHLMQPIPRPSETRPGEVPPALDHVIAKGMAKNPAERYRSAGELAAAAHDALTATEQVQAATILRQGDNATLLAGGAAGAAGAAAGFREQAQPQPTGSGPDSDSWTRPAWASYTDTGGSSWPSQPGIPTSAAPVAAPDFSKAPEEPEHHGRRWAIIGAIALVVVGVVVAAAILLFHPQSSSKSANGQTVLPFNGLNFRLSPGGVALDSAGNVYVTNQGMYGRVVKLAPGSTTPSVLPFTGLYEPQGLAVDAAGAVYVTDFNNRVVKLAAGSNNQTELPITGLNYPEGLAVDSAGNVYVADRGNNRVVKLDESNNQTDLPFTDLKHPDAVALDNAGNIYVTDSDNNRVLKLEAGSNTPVELPFGPLSVPWGIAVDDAGTVYVTEHDTSKVVKLEAGSSTPVVLPFEGLNTPLDVDIDKDHNIYVADRGNNRVVKLPPTKSN
ncbi:Transmembrane serine/threonine-protein kinase D PknD (protein kinase D) (STPK D) [Mycobacterium tuberculosis H37Rv] [Mycobacterium shimoidei]|uniref:non-specific serine/threonine protein kinase n=1 Tax=Mycobacterium shimoidei TaxID=29313 RepID=A0A375YXS0_MYCSH|nr:serine/threonine-protein kinase PknD [Mycobacterium shimoidei]SRX93657.1 Transmembrane serine/threonine-protein kinase D PknD (protein kinase D) (STPK D) [Mycobacterium tuberculosis H37Rv] [Mycobacterium shimoidei]